MSRSAARWALLALLAVAGLRGEDPYAAWSAGRPGEALPALHAQAEARGTWDAWFDLGLCAAAAGERGRAVVWLLEAQRRAPARPEPRQALDALGAGLPPALSARLGALAEPGSGPAALPLAILAGALLGYGILGRRGRLAALLLGAGALVVLVPGATAAWLDGRRHWIAAAGDTQLLDSTGAPLRPLAAGSVVERLPGEPWNGRLAVRCPDGTRGWLPEADTRAGP